MNLSKFSKITFSELENLPIKYLHCVYKEYDDTMRDPKKQEALASEQAEEQILGAIGGS